MTKIIINERQYNKLLLTEGYELTPVDNTTVSMHFNNQDLSDKANKNADTRIFGDRTSNLTNLMQQKLNAQKKINEYKSVIDALQTGNMDKVKSLYSLTEKEKESIMSMDLSDEISVNGKISSYQDKIDKLETNIGAYDAMWNQASSSNQAIRGERGNDLTDRITKYFVGEVPGSGGIKYISLFTMKSFNINTAMKHGEMNTNIETLSPFIKADRKDIRNNNKPRYGYTTSRDYLEATGQRNVDVKFDNKAKGYKFSNGKRVDNQPVLNNLFSLNNIPNDNQKYSHYRENYGLGNADDIENNDYSNGYTTTHEFLDKSIMYASYALRKEHFMPRIIVCPPSSSEFNKLYCRRLASTINSEFIDDFFKQSPLTTKYNYEAMEADGVVLKELDKQAINAFAIGSVKQGMNAEWSKLINTFLSKKQGTLYKISKKYGTNVGDMESDLKDYFKNQLYDYFKERKNNTAQYISEYLIINLKSANFKKTNKTALNDFITGKLNIRDISDTLSQAEQLYERYAKELDSTGIRVSFSDKQYKITKISGRFRKYINDMYVVSTEELKKNGTKSIGFYRNSNVLMFDEDMGSGATLRLSLEGLRNFKNDMNSKNTMCLVNAFSFSK